MSLAIKGLVKRLGTFSLHIELNMEDGEFLAVLGPSGSGKTTLLRLIAGFIRPDSGRIMIDDEDVTEVPVHRRRIGMVFQDYALFPHLNVAANLEYGLKFQSLHRQERKERVGRMLDVMGIRYLAGRRIDEISGGEQQRCALARALIIQPRILLLDEPLSAVDTGLRRDLRREITRVQRRFRIPVVYVSHDQTEAMAVADRIALIKDGGIRQLAAPETLYRHPRDLFTARFMGISNLIPLPETYSGPPQGIHFRPEYVRILEDARIDGPAVALPKALEGHGEANGRGPGPAPQGPGRVTRPLGLYAEVQRVEYQGERYLVEATAGGCLVRFYSSSRPELGTRLSLEVPGEALEVLLLDEDGEGLDA